MRGLRTSLFRYWSHKEIIINPTLASAADTKPKRYQTKKSINIPFTTT
jgi:hypothetical protein